MKRAIIMASLLAVAAMSTGLAVEPAFSAPTNHTLTFVSRGLASQQSAPNHLLQASTNQVAGAHRRVRRINMYRPLLHRRFYLRPRRGRRPRHALRPRVHQHQQRHGDRQGHRRNPRLQRSNRNRKRSPRNPIRRNRHHNRLPHLTDPSACFCSSHFFPFWLR